MKRRLFWIVELFIWLLILFLVSGGIMFAKYDYRKVFNTYQIFLPDVDGLINGSPVKFMGIQVGYVNQLDIVGEDVYVKFVITESNIEIPQGSIATVESSGLGGSKSLELYPPSSDKNFPKKFIIPQSPKRIHDSLGLLNDMFDKFIDITYDISHFMDEVDIIKIKKHIEGVSTKSADDFLESSNDWLDKTQEKCGKIADKLNNKKDGKNERRSDQGN